MQAALPCFLMGNGPGTMTLRGGTNAEMAPPIDYTIMVCPNFNCLKAFLYYISSTCFIKVYIQLMQDPLCILQKEVIFQGMKFHCFLY